MLLGLIVLHYHRVTSGPIMGGGWVVPKQFEFHLRQLEKWGFIPVEPDEVLTETEERTFLLTFDDAYADIYTNALPVMARSGIKGIVFPVAGFMGKRPLWDVTWGTPGVHMGAVELRKLAALGWEIGSHTMTHPDLTKLNQDNLRTELEDSKKLLEDTLGRRIRFLAYPFGRFNQRVKDAAREAGYEAGFTMRRRRSLDWTDPMEIPRMSVYLPDYSLFRKMEPMYMGVDCIVERLINLNAGGTAWVRHSAPYLGRLLGIKVDRNN
ncbi:MAG: polysaccharide deacetylase family protein [candidate division WOR-3 bacterium]